MVARSGARLHALRAELAEQGVEAWVRECDITDLGSVHSAVAAVQETFGRLDTVIDFAAQTGPLDCATWDVSPADWSAVLSTNLSGVYHVLHSCVPHLLEHGSGRLLVVSSPFGETVTPGMGAYPASRAGSDALIHQAAAELRGTGVAAAILHPGITETEGLAEFRRARGARRGGGGCDAPSGHGQAVRLGGSATPRTDQWRSSGMVRSGGAYGGADVAPGLTGPKHLRVQSGPGCPGRCCARWLNDA